MASTVATVVRVTEEPPRMRQIGEATPALPALCPLVAPRWVGAKASCFSPISREPRKSRLKSSQLVGNSAVNYSNVPEPRGWDHRARGSLELLGGSPSSSGLSQVLQGT